MKTTKKKVWKMCLLKSCASQVTSQLQTLMTIQFQVKLFAHFQLRQL